MNAQIDHLENRPSKASGLPADQMIPGRLESLAASSRSKPQRIPARDTNHDHDSGS